MTGRRLNVWIPAEDMWIFDAITQVRSQMEQLGARLSQGEVVRIGLKQYLEEYLDENASETGETEDA